MQISEMRTFRNLYYQKDLLNLIKLKFISNPNVSISKSRKIRCFSCQFRSIDQRSIHSSSRWSDNVGRACESSSVADDGDENPRVWTAFDPVSNEVITRKMGEDEIRKDDLDSEDERPVTLGSLSSFIEGSLPERLAGGGKKNSVDEEISSGSFIEGSLPERLASGGKKNFDKEKISGTPKSWSNLYRREEKVTPKRSENRGDENLMRESVSNSNVGDLVPKKKQGKSRSSWVCSDCGYSCGQWWGSCRSCGATGTLTQFSESQSDESKPSGFSVADKVAGTWFHEKLGGLTPQRLTDVNKGVNQLTWRIPLPGLFGAEVARVLGGGLVPGSLVLVGGDPGVGKSTLLLQIAAMIAEEGDLGKPAPVLYVSGEESVEQIGNRADRMKIGTEDLFLYSSTDIEDILVKIQALSPRALIVDSIQTVYLKGVTGSAGGVVQVKECTSSLLRFAKKTNIPVLLIGHVTKTGEIAGPRILEHIVDVVLYMEGEEYSAHRFLRSVKNRFGSTDELGVFEMSQKGLQAVLNPSEIFLSEQHPDSEILAGLAVAVIVDGSRTFLLEIQALCLCDSAVTRQYNGVQSNRAEMIIAVLIKQAGLKLQNNAIFINIVSGVKLTETAGDLAIAAAVCSSYLEFPIPNDVAFIGEVGLGGELRPVRGMEKRVNAVVKLGYKKCIVPKSAVERLTTLDLNGLMILGCRNLKEVINNVFQT